ncbi:sarcolemmal membrane-associated protein [Drosophila novamexicana]|uniref:sarcolemmal membrane-associated protein n=1 Tax=Drosophila novamexicana TaxID=47314 RepID=UPI0011E5B72C|nr:sarcolemmal membrane-associated protein [Drosophila novamexicana]
MVLVSNEWQSNKDDEQKPNAAAAASAAAIATTTTTATAAVAAAVNNVTDQELTARPVAVASGVVGELSKRQQRINKKAHNKMELSKKAEQEHQQHQQQQQQLLLMREKHESETCELPTENSNNSSSNNINNSILNSNDANDNLENQENNNTSATESCDSNTNTLLQGQLAQKQAQLQLAMNSVLNANNTTSGNLFSSMGALQLPNETVANTLLNTQDMSPGEAKIVLQCEGKSHKFETRNILLAPNQECKVGRLIAKSKASESNAIFDCKVLSRNHAMLWYTPDGRFWVKDTKSSNGTFINDNKLGNEPAELHYGDTVKFGVEVIENSRQEVHGCIIARVTLFLPDGREAISIESEQLQLTGPNRISYDEIQRLNAFLQEASQREKMLKAKLSSLQGVIDSTRKNAALCWQSMITEDQLLHKINLLEKKLQMMEKNVPENALRNEVVKLLEDKTSYQLTAKEALRKVYQDRCDAMEMLSKMEMAYTTSDNECGILRAQILSSKQTLQDFNTRLDQLQQEYTEYKQETLHQQQEAKEQEEQRLGQLKEQLIAQESEMEQMRQQLLQLRQTIADQNSEQALQQQQTLEQLNAAIGVGDDDDDDEDDEDDDNDDNDDDDDDDEEKEAGDHDNGADNKDEYQVDKGGAQLGETSELLDKEQTTPSKRKSCKKSKRQQKEEFDLKHKVVRKDTMLKWLKNSDLKGADGGDVLKAIFNAADSGDEEVEQKPPSTDSSPTGGTAAETAFDEFVHKSPKHARLNGIDEAAEESSIHKLETQQTLVRNDETVDEDLPHDQAMDMLHEECLFYKQRSATLASDISILEEEMNKLKQQLLEQQLEQPQPRSSSGAEEKLDDLVTDELEPLLPNDSKEIDGELSSWREELKTMNDAQVEREEELIVYKERLEQSENSNLELRNEITKLRLKQPLAYDHQVFFRRALPLCCVALAAIIYFLSIRV